MLEGRLSFLTVRIRPLTAISNIGCPLLESQRRPHFVRSCTRSRRPARALPSIRSDSPAPYNGAVSKEVTPWSTPQWINLVRSGSARPGSPIAPKDDRAQLDCGHYGPSKASHEVVVGIFVVSVDPATYPSLDCVPVDVWGHSSAGRALQWHCRGRRFDPGWLHHLALDSCTLSTVPIV